MASFGMFWWAPITSKWMSMLERLVPGKTGAALIKKIFVDQAIFSPLVLSAFFTVYESKFYLRAPLDQEKETLHLFGFIRNRFVNKKLFKIFLQSQCSMGLRQLKIKLNASYGPLCCQTGVYGDQECVFFIFL